jgi:hypothetical protein
VLGAFWQIWHNAQGHSASLLGMYRMTGWWYYFPVAFTLKVPLPFFLLSISSLAWSIYRFVKKREKKFLIILVPFAAYTAFVLFSQINIGVRYYLPAFPFLLIASGAFLDWLLTLRARRVGLTVAGLLICWMVIEAVRAFPNHMSYFNQLASSRPHWWYLSDSNVEWGDDIKELTEYLHARGETQVTGAFLSAYVIPRLYDIDYVDLVMLQQHPPPTRYVAIGASFLNGSTMPSFTIGDALVSDDRRVNYLDGYRRRAPEVKLGQSIYLYRVRD